MISEETGKSIKILLAVIIFVLGIAHIMRYSRKEVVEGYKGKKKCPNLLVKKYNKYHLVNTNAKQIPGVNPIEFNSLDEYATFVKYQKDNGIKCPILYYEESYDAQGNRGYRQYAGPIDRDGGIPSAKINELDKDISEEILLTDANRDKAPFNQNNYAGFDPDDQEIGIVTPLDNVKSQHNPSSNAMDNNWGGREYTDNMIDAGEFDGRKRTLK